MARWLNLLVSSRWFVRKALLPHQTFPTYSAEPQRTFLDTQLHPANNQSLTSTPRAPHLNQRVNFSELDRQQIAHCAKCASLWQALKALTNDSLIRRKAGSVEGEMGEKQVATAVRRIGSGLSPKHREGRLRGGRQNNPSHHACCQTVQEEEKI